MGKWICDKICRSLSYRSRAIQQWCGWGWFYISTNYNISIISFSRYSVSVSRNIFSFLIKRFTSIKTSHHYLVYFLVPLHSIIIIIIIITTEPRHIIGSVNKNQIYSTYPMFIFVKLAFPGQCLHLQVYTLILWYKNDCKIFWYFTNSYN